MNQYSHKRKKEMLHNFQFNWTKRPFEAEIETKSLERQYILNTATERAGCNKKEWITTAAMAVHILSGTIQEQNHHVNIAGKKSYTCTSLKIQVI